MAKPKLKIVCSPKPRLEERPLVGNSESRELEAVFKTLSSSSRLKMIHALVKAKKLCVAELAQSVGMKSQAVSNQLQRLVDRGILLAERRGNKIYYSIADPCVVTLLDQGWCLIEEARQRLRTRKGKS